MESRNGGVKKIGSVMNEWHERMERMQKEEERIAREKAEFDALPEEEKQRILAQREQERMERERRAACMIFIRSDDSTGLRFTTSFSATARTKV
jgi:hypothetical protein